MNSFRRSAKNAASTALIALIVSFAPYNAHAQSSGGSTSFLDSKTSLRTIRKQATNFDSSTGAPTTDSSGNSTTSYNGNPACNQNVMQSMQDSANFSASQNTVVHVNTLQLPSSFSSCLSGLLSGAQTQNNAFSVTSAFNISAIFTSLLNKQINTMITTLETKACSATKAAVKSASGPIGSVERDFSQFSKGGAIMTAAPGSNSSTGFITPQ